jgi:uncharacterized protein YqeY
MDIDKLIKEATLNKNGAAKEAFRAVKAELLKNQTSKNPKSNGKFVCVTGLDSWISNVELYELDIEIIRRLIKQRDESASIYDANSRKDLADLEREQIKYLKELLPPEISEDKIQEAVMTSYPNGFTQKEMGKVIKEIKSIYPTADGKLISEVVKKHIV